MNDMLTFEIDLNMLRGDTVQSHVDFMHRADSRLRQPETGETVWAVDEDDARYLAVLDSVASSGFVDLRLKLDTRKSVKVELPPPYVPKNAEATAGTLTFSAATRSPAVAV